MAFTSVLKQVGIRQNSKAELVFLRVDESAISGNTNAGLLEGAQQAVISKAGDGDYTITLNRTGRRTLAVVGVVPLTAGLDVSIASPDENSVQVLLANDGVATASDFHITICAFYSEFDR